MKAAAPKIPLGRQRRPSVPAFGLAMSMGVLSIAPAVAQVPATTTAAIMSATVSALPSCLAYQLTGVCFWLRCTPFGCSVKTSIKVSHYVPDVVVSTYSAPEQHPWGDVGKPVAIALSGVGTTMMGSILDASANTAREAQEVVTFKSTDAFGNPVGAIMGGTTTFEFPDFEELMSFPSRELPRIVQMWASVPIDLSNGILEGARNTAMNPSALLGELGSSIGQFAGLLSSVSNWSGSLSSTMPQGANSDVGGGGSEDSAGNGQSTPYSDMMDQMRRGLSAGGAGASEYLCPGGSGMLSIQYHSELDSLFWRGKIPLELLYPGSWVPGIGEVGNSLLNTWGGGYPRMGELVQSHPRKASAVFAYRTGSIIRQQAQPHVYKRLYPKGSHYRYFLSMATPMWQPVFPRPEPTCMNFGTGFGSNDSVTLGSWGDYKTSSNDGYIWNLWHRYECCKKAAEIFLFSVP